VTATQQLVAVDAAPPESIACQHVLVAYKGAKNAPANVTRSKADAKARAEEVRTKAVAGDDMAELAKTYSDDQGSRERLGSVGKFKRDGMVKPFSDAAFALKVNEISAVVETPFGFHVIKRNQ
jgi:peptidyl-prolyl cis-trans isomerase NIMA-interacting 1